MGWAGDDHYFPGSGNRRLESVPIQRIPDRGETSFAAGSATARSGPAFIAMQVTLRVGRRLEAIGVVQQ